MPIFMVSAKATIVAPNNMLLQSLAACPVPDLPHEITRAPILSSSDSTSLGIVSLPPTMKVRVPASAPTTPDKKRDQSLYTPLVFIFCFCKVWEIYIGDCRIQFLGGIFTSRYWCIEKWMVLFLRKLPNFLCQDWINSAAVDERCVFFGAVSADYKGNTDSYTETVNRWKK